MNTLSIIRVTRPINKFDSLERFCAAMQSIKMWHEDIDSDPEFAEEEGLHRLLADQVGTAVIALNELPPEWQAIMRPEFDQLVRK